MTFKFHPFKRLNEKFKDMRAEHMLRKKIRAFGKIMESAGADMEKAAKKAMGMLNCKADERSIIRMITSPDVHHVDRMHMLSFLEMKRKSGEDLSEFAYFLLDEKWLAAPTDQEKVQDKTLDLLKSIILDSKDSKTMIKLLYNVSMYIQVSGNSFANKFGDKLAKEIFIWALTRPETRASAMAVIYANILLLVRPENSGAVFHILGSALKIAPVVAVDLCVVVRHVIESPEFQKERDKHSEQYLSKTAVLMRIMRDARIAVDNPQYSAYKDLIKEVISDLVKDLVVFARNTFDSPEFQEEVNRNSTKYVSLITALAQILGDAEIVLDGQQIKANAGK